MAQSAMRSTDTSVVSNVTYYPFGPVASITYGTGAASRTLTRAYDQDYVISAVTDPKTPGLQMTYGRDVLGNLTQVTFGSGGVNNFAYDGLNRLTGVTNSSGTPVWTYTYDATGNRLSKKSGAQPAVPYAYPSTSHQLAAVGSVARTYDEVGNTRTIGSSAQTFVYDDTGRMNQLKNSGTLVKNYTYDARGERVRKSHNGFPTEMVRTVYDEAGHVLGDFDNNGAIIHQYIWLDDLPVGVLSGATPTLSYIEPDHLGTPRKISDPARNNVTVWSWSLLNDPFGETAPNQDTDGDGTQFVFNMRLPGQYFDAESGLSYNYFRDYDSNAGRYIESDPIGLKGGVATFSYALGSPINLVDSFGQVVWTGSMTGGVFLTGGLYSLHLHTDCVGGKRATAHVIAVGPGLGSSLNLKIFSRLPERWSASRQGVKLEDSMAIPLPSSLTGMFMYGGYNSPIFGCNVLVVGAASSGHPGGASIGCSPQAEFGQAGASILVGSSTAISGKVEDCKECEGGAGSGGGGGGW